MQQNKVAHMCEELLSDIGICKPCNKISETKTDYMKEMFEQMKEMTIVLGRFAEFMQNCQNVAG